MKNRYLSVKLLLICGLFTVGKAYSQNYEGIIKNYISNTNGSKFVKNDLKDFEISNQDFSSSMNSEVVKIQQTYNGIPVYNSVATALIKDSDVKFYTENFVKNYDVVSSAKAGLTDAAAFKSVAKKLKLNGDEYRLLDILAKEDGLKSVAKRRLVYFKSEENLVLCYEFFVEEKNNSNYWNILVDANSGKILEENNLTLSCNFNDDAFSQTLTDHLPESVKTIAAEEIKKLNAAAGTASYRVFALPLEGPTFGTRTLVTDPWFLDASPEGWQSNGVTSYTTTQGNNAYAYSDQNGINVPQAVPDAGAGRVFDYPYGALSSANENLASATTNLFYMNNKMHDIMYRFGFTEAARNFQSNNFSKGGAGNDYVRAEAQDGSGSNNANFSTPIDGSLPRMQMYLWDSNLVDAKRLYYNTPAEAVSRLAKTFGAQFGPALSNPGVTGDLKLASPIDGCTALPAASMLNNIALIERGTCGFVVKVKNAQTAGAIGVVIYNGAASPAIGTMGGTDATITIPSIITENSEGEYIKSLLAASKTVNVTLKFSKFDANYLDGSYDNGIVAHEYGHGISNRNTGDGYRCLNSANSNEQMGEGWSDFFALMVTNQPNATATVARGIGTYAVGQPTNGLGIRPQKYSTDSAVNNVTYGYTNGKTYVDANGVTQLDVHTIGFVWASMLWDLHWNFAAKYGYASDVAANPTSGSGKVLQLVINGLKGQICSPTFIDGRDAILAADALGGGTDRCMIWNTFAKRGLGVSASAGTKTGTGTGISDQIEDFTIPSDCSPLSTSENVKDKSLSIYPNPAKNEFFIKVPTSQLGKLSVEVYDAAGRLVTSDKVSGSESVSTAKLQNGVYIVKVKGLGVESSSKLIIKK
ncbi:T9SS-dependent M36 family metallopeptidase [Halpernia frigidisoli]|uniref:Por secretion system C-terminal sorting domain-containing protein n=1 Tax=Halpernia frigidisoli TaxID=1125876 RepID=A0A1I3E4E0_9FLAO|nr:T9SS-dependent M36 family metallopeptidase [Halpernia frigidisoli]SFH93673.1 Por secretion system C-terminal sorting domain-containing protein [Halpernia frigidisoli]